MHNLPTIKLKKKKVSYTEVDSESRKSIKKNIEVEYLETENLPVLGFDNSPTMLYIRDCYPKIFDYMYNKKNVKKFVVTGTPGIGKTFGGVYFVHRLCNLEKPPKLLVYRYGVLGDETTFLFKNGIFDHAISNPKEFSRIIKDESNAWFVFDPPKHIEQTDADSWNCHVIIVSSPDQERYSKILSGQNSLALYLPIWTKQELEIASQLVFQSRDWKDRYEFWGGIPRKLFDTNNKYELSDFKELMNSFQEINMSQVLTHTMEINSKTFSGDQKALHSFLHLDVKRDDNGNYLFTKPKTIWASYQAYDLALEKYDSETQLSIRRLLEQQTNLGIGGTAPGFHFENSAHRILRDALKDASKLRVKRLNDPKKECNYQFQIKEYKVFQDINKIEISLNTLYVPLKRNLKSVDSFMVIESNNLPFTDSTRKSKRNEPVLSILAFQVTVRKDGHPVMFSGLEEVFNLCSKTFPKRNMDLHLIFCVPKHLYEEKAYNKLQTIKDIDKNSKFSVKAQYAVSFEFDDIAKNELLQHK